VKPAILWCVMDGKQPCSCATTQREAIRLATYGIPRIWQNAKRKGARCVKFVEAPAP